MPSNTTSAIAGQLGETLVVRWLQQQGWKIVGQGWHCRWGELDVVALRSNPHCLAFIEVKTRKSGNWDENGLLAITPTKQRKLIYSSQLFLSRFPHWAEVPCRFDVALVGAKQIGNTQALMADQGGWPQIQLGKAIVHQGYQLTLSTYLESAFDAVY
jgi:putative endonuclease